MTPAVPPRAPGVAGPPAAPPPVAPPPPPIVPPPGRRGGGRRHHPALWGAIAAVAVFVVGLGVLLAVDVSHPPGSHRTTPTTSPTPSPSTATELVEAAAAALRAAPTAHVAGTVGGPAGLIAVDVLVTRSGDATGVLRVGGLPVQVVRSGGTTYIRSRALVRKLAGSLAATVAGDHWLVIGAQQFAGLGINHALDDATRLDSLANLVAAAAPGAHAVGPVQVGTIPAARVASGPTTVDIRRASPPYPLRISAPGGVVLSLSGFGQPVHVQPPTKGVLDIGKLPGIG